MITLAGVVLIGVAFALFYHFKISRPIMEIRSATNDISGGRMDARAPVHSENQIGQLAAAFNQMMRRLEPEFKKAMADRDELSAILSSMVEQVIAVDLQGKVLFVNPAAEKLFIVINRNVIGRPFVEVIRQASISEVLNAVLNDRAEKSGELRLFLNEEKFFEMKAFPLKSGEDYRGALLVLHDLTQIQKLEQVRKDFIANVSHELRTPLTSIQGFSETLLDGGLEDQKNNLSFVESIHSESKRLSNLVNDLLDLSSIESGKTKPKLSVFSLCKVSLDVEAELLVAAKKLGVTVRNRISPELFIQADAGQMKQVFLNLLDNAIKFNKKGGEIFLDAMENSALVEVNVQDTGSGIPAKDLPRVFERFYRVDKARSRDLGGTGLGLAIVKHIVEANGGSIRVESVEGEGSSFIITFPKSTAETPAVNL